MVRKYHTPGSIPISLYNIFCHKSDIITTVFETCPPNVTFRRDLNSCGMEYLVRAIVLGQVITRIDEFSWNLRENGKLPVDFMYSAFVKKDVLVDNNTKI